MKLLKSSILLLAACCLGACTEESPVTNPPKTPAEPEVFDNSGFAKGADVSWLTQLESEGVTFTDAAGNATECMRLLRDQCGVNSIRLRVWVNPAEGWNNIDDVMLKARRAASLNQRLMIDFHFSDTWADPGSQATPAAWADYDLDGLKTAVADHVTAMLSRLQAQGITPEWVQIGNETRGGMLYPIGSIDDPAAFTALVNAGYDAVKAIFPEALVIVHLDSGDKEWIYDRIFGALADNGGKYDIIGMSLYPDADSYEATVDACLANIKRLNAAYGKRLMICEVGMDYDKAVEADLMMRRLYAGCVESGVVDGIFYWEPEAPAGYNGGYNKGCFADGTPTQALDVFKAAN